MCSRLFAAALPGCVVRQSLSRIDGVDAAHGGIVVS
jgi:hypothetical protein